MDFEQYMKNYMNKVMPGTTEWHNLAKTWDASKMQVAELAKATLSEKVHAFAKNSDDVLEGALNYLESAFQSKRAHLKAQVSNFMGKHSIVKHENNKLRKKVRRAEKCIHELSCEIGRLAALLKPKPSPENVAYKVVGVAKANGVSKTAIARTFSHDEGAEGKCSYCGRYSADPNCLKAGFECDCGKANGFTGSFKTPTDVSVWCAIKELV